MKNKITFKRTTVVFAVAVLLIGCGLVETLKNAADDLAAKVQLQLERLPELGDAAGDAIQSGLDAVNLNSLAAGVKGMVPGITARLEGGVDGAPAAFAPMAIGDSCPIAPLSVKPGDICTYTENKGSEVNLVDIYVDPDNFALDATGNIIEGRPAAHIIDLSTTLDFPRRSGSRRYTDVDFANGTTAADLWVDEIIIRQELNTKVGETLRELRTIDILQGSFHGAPDGNLNLRGINGVVDQADTVSMFTRIVELDSGRSVSETATPAEVVLVSELNNKDKLIPGTYSRIVKNTFAGARVAVVTSTLTIVDAETLTGKEVIEYADNTTEFSTTSVASGIVTIYRNARGGSIDLTVNNNEGTVARTITFAADHRLIRIEETGSVSESGASLTRIITPREGDPITEHVTVERTTDEVKVTYDRSDGTSGTVSVTESTEGQFISADVITREGARVLVDALVHEDGSATVHVSIDFENDGVFDAEGTVEREPNGALKGIIRVKGADGVAHDTPLDRPGL